MTQPILIPHDKLTDLQKTKHYFALPRSRREAKHCDERVCTLVHSSILKTTCSNFTRFFVHVTCVHDSVLLRQQCNMLCILVLWMFVPTGRLVTPCSSECTHLWWAPSRHYALCTSSRRVHSLPRGVDGWSMISWLPCFDKQQMTVKKPTNCLPCCF